MKKNIIVFLLSFWFVSCLTKEALTVCNNSDHNIFFYVGMEKYIYPDTLFINTPPDTEIPKRRCIIADIDGKQSDWHEWYGYFKTDTLSFFIFNSDTLNKYTWEVIQKEYKILRRYDLSLQDLKYLEYKIYYPPTPKMRDMKMYPPYEVDVE